MLLLIGLTIYFAVKSTFGLITVSPQGSPVYFPVGVPATISCTVQVPSGNVEQSVLLVQLANATDTGATLNCRTAQSNPPLEYLSSHSFGNVTLNRSYPKPSAIACRYTFPSIRDGSYSCNAVYLSSTDVQLFDVVTTRKPDGPYINNGSTQIIANEGDRLTVTCVVLNGKPAYSVSWDASDIVNAGTALASQSSSNDYTNSSTLFSVTASDAMNGRSLTCNAKCSIPNLWNASASVILNIYYGPTNSGVSLVSAQARVITIVCSLLSNPAINTYAWFLDNNSFSCTTQSCNVSYSGQRFGRYLCQGRNPATGRKAQWNITVDWPFEANVSGLHEETTSNVALAVGLAIGGVVIVAIAIVLAIFVKRKLALSRSTLPANERETSLKKSTHSIDRREKDMRDEFHGHPEESNEKWCHDVRATQTVVSGHVRHSLAVGQVKSQHNKSDGKVTINSKRNLRGGTSQHSRH